MRVISAAPEGSASAAVRQTTNSDDEIEASAAMGLDQRSRLQLLLFKNEHKVSLQFCGESEYRLAIKSRPNVLWGRQDRCIVVGAKPFFSHIDRGRISPDENALPLSWQESMKTMGDRESNASWWRFGGATVQ
jgi:hypothetical protein